jgi:hypothetical protein
MSEEGLQVTINSIKLVLKVVGKNLVRFTVEKKSL